MRPTRSAAQLDVGPLNSQIYKQSSEVLEKLSIASQLLQAQMSSAAKSGDSRTDILHPVLIAFPSLDDVVLIKLDQIIVSEFHDWAKNKKFTLEAMQKILHGRTPSTVVETSDAQATVSGQDTADDDTIPHAEAGMSTILNVLLTEIWFTK